jgi:restriction system protein
MAATEFPTYDRLMQPTMDALRAHGGQASNQQIYDWVAAYLNLAPEVMAQPHKSGSSLSEVEYRLMWSRTYLRKVGLIDSPMRGVWTLTPLGFATHRIRAGDIVKAVKKHMQMDKTPVSYDSDEHSASADAYPSQIENDGDVASSISPTPNFPHYSEARHFLRILDGVSYALYREMSNALYEQRGNPQEQVDWTNPDGWISLRLTGDAAKLATKFWLESGHRVNPRYTRGIWYLAMRHALLERRGEQLAVTSTGWEFVEQPLGSLEARIDHIEGVMVVLRLVADRGPARRSDIFDDYAHYCRTHTTIRSDSAIKSFLYNRLVNLIDRQLIIGRGQRYEVTEKGLAYLRQFAEYIPGSHVQNDQQADIQVLAKQLSEGARKELYDYLLEMNPFAFESLIKRLMEEIGYTEVTKTSDTNDKGVDVVAHIELGITSVREVIQVKRHKGAINRVTLDQLRGSLYRFNAVRGTIITTGHFTKGAQDAAFERGAPPITLIDGEKLVDLLIDKELGVKKNTVHYYEFSSDDLVQMNGEEAPIV